MWDQKIILILFLRRTQILESYNILICYCIRFTSKISGNMTLVKIRNTVFQYPRIQYICIVVVSWIPQAKQSIRIGLFRLWVYIKKLQALESFNFLTYLFYKGVANEIDTLPWERKFMKLYFGLLNLRPCAVKLY